MEDVLYPSAVTMGTTGALYRLLNRCGARGMALPLRRTSIAAGHVTEGEFEQLKALCHPGVRVFTLVPMGAVGLERFWECDPKHP